MVEIKIQERQTGRAALVVIVFVLVLSFFIVGKLQINAEDTPDDNRSNYKGSSETLKRLNEGLPDCSQCVKNCQWTTLRSLEKCQAECIPEETCLPVDLTGP